MSANPWNDKAIAKLKELWPNPSVSCAAIAEEIGITRNAVIGKARRLGLGSKQSDAPQANKNKRLHHLPPKPRQYKPKPARNFGGVWNGYPNQQEPEPFVPRAVVLPSLDLPIEDWRDDRCKYIAGDDGLACGHPVKADKPYCPAHCAIVYYKRTERTLAQKAWDAKLGQRTARRTSDAQAWVAEEVA